MSDHDPLVASTTFPAAGLERRFYAFTIDRLVAWAVYAGAAYAAYVFLIEPGNLWGGLGAIAGTVLLVGTATAVALGTAGLSPGKAAVGLRVVEDRTGRPIGVGRALLRQLVVGAATLPTFGLGLATLAWTAVMDGAGQRRGWHDRLAHAIVVDVRPAPAVVEVEEARPRHIVNLTAMRLVPAPHVAIAPPPVRTARPTAPPLPPDPAPASPPLSPPPLSPPPLSPPPLSPPPAALAGPPAVPPEGPAAGSPGAATLRRQPGSPQPGSPRRGASPAGPGGARRAAPAAPAVWRVSFDTGESFLVEGLALVGRRPEPRAEEPVRHVVALRSSDMSLSKTHAQFQVVPDGALVVMDRGSTNGSVVVRGGVARELAAGRPATLRDGDRVRFGDRTMSVRRED